MQILVFYMLPHGFDRRLPEFFFNFLFGFTWASYPVEHMVKLEAGTPSLDSAKHTKTPRHKK